MNPKTHTEANYNQTFENKDKEQQEWSDSPHTRQSSQWDWQVYHQRLRGTAGSRLIHSKWLKQQPPPCRHPTAWQKLSFKSEKKKNPKNIRTFQFWWVFFVVVLFSFLVWRCWRSSPGLCMCWAGALLLSCYPSSTGLWAWQNGNSGNHVLCFSNCFQISKSGGSLVLVGLPYRHGLRVSFEVKWRYTGQ